MSATFGKIGARDLVWKPPYDAEVEYLESNGTQYIDTGVVPTSTIGTKFTFKPKVPYDKVVILAGGDKVYWRWGFTTASLSYMIQVANINTIGFTNYPMGQGKHTVEYNFDGTRNCYLDGRLIAENLNYSNTVRNTTIWINSSYNGGSYPWRTNSMFIYECKITDNGILIRDFIPVRVGSGSAAVGYLYNLANPTGGPLGNGLYPNAGTGAFILGPDKVGGG